MNFWKNILKTLEHGNQAMLLYVVDNSGSSPGKQGFKMAVADTGEMYGSVGGGIMEQKLVELAKTYLNESDFRPVLKRQIHNKSVSENQSGLICSGEQTVAFYQLKPSDIELIQQIAESNTSTLILNEIGFSISEASNIDTQFEQTEEQNWTYKERLNRKPTIHIIGAGHVGLALSKVLALLDFKIHIYDDREHLNTLQQNEFVDKSHIIDYEEIGNYIQSDEQDFIVLVSFGYRTDKIALKQLIHHQFKYIGMMGSEAKIEQLFSELQHEGITKEELNKLHAPIGLLKHGKSPEEIAISIAAQLIDINNKT